MRGAAAGQSCEETERWWRVGYSDLWSVGEHRGDEQLQAEAKVLESGRTLRPPRCPPGPQLPSHSGGDQGALGDHILGLGHCSEAGCDEVADGRQQVGVVGKRSHEGNPAGLSRGDATAYEPRGGHQ